MKTPWPLAFLVGWCIATHIVPLDPRSDLIFFEEIKEDGLQFRLRVELNTPSNVVFRVYEPHELHDRENMEKKEFSQFALRKDYFYDKKGLYMIQLNNLDSKPVLSVIKSVVDKPYEASNDFSDLRRSLVTLEDELGSTYNANMQLKEMKERHIRDAKRMLKRLTMLCILPLFYVGIGFVKMQKMKRFFQPKK